MEQWFHGWLNALRRRERRPAPNQERGLAFDDLARDLARGSTRREALERLGGYLIGAALAFLGLDRAWSQGNSDCAHFCNAIFPPGDQRGACKSEAAQGGGICSKCGPAAPLGHGPVCGVLVNPFCCNPGETCCSNALCANLKTDVKNCGMCGNLCPPRPNATPVCDQGQCSFVCLAGFGNCDASVANGCETNLLTDVGNCGACGNQCPTPANATPTCVGGTCGFVCNAGFADCDLNASNGCETNILTNPQHCGACNNLCPTPANATAICSNGACGFTCNAGFANCDNNPANGCETNTSSNVNNCGACGNRCPAGAGCSSGVCACPAGTFNSNGVCCPTGTTNCGGACVNTSSDTNNCGACNNPCPAGQSCVGGMCSGGGGGCPPGTTNCSGVCANTSNDANNCGTCGNACAAQAPPGRPPAGMYCCGGQCQGCWYSCGALFNTPGVQCCDPTTGRGWCCPPPCLGNPGQVCGPTYGTCI